MDSKHSALSAPANSSGKVSGLKTRLGIVGELFRLSLGGQNVVADPMIIALIVFAIVIVSARPAAAAR